jgi:hypothetical protein
LRQIVESAVHNVKGQLGLEAEAGEHPEGITVRVGLGRLSMQLISATCEDGVIRQYQPAHIRLRIEAIRDLPS